MESKKEPKKEASQKLHRSFVRYRVSPARIERTLDGSEPSGFSISLQGLE